jgi:hypothetical protein
MPAPIRFRARQPNMRRRVSQQMGVADQFVLAFNARNRLATVLGFIAGGVVPVATYVEAHWDLNNSLPLHSQAPTFMVLGGLLFSAKTVFTWAKRAFQDGWKAAGFVVLLEGVMITSKVPVLPLVLLAILVAINGVATGCVLSLERSRTRAAHGREVLSMAIPEPLVTAAATMPAVVRSKRRPSSSLKRNGSDAQEIMLRQDPQGELWAASVAQEIERGFRNN